MRLPEDLVGLAIGAQGANIQAARRIPGILSVEVDEPNCTFHIVGENQVCVTEARKLLEFAEETVHVPRTYVGKWHKNMVVIYHPRCLLESPKALS